MRSQERDWRGSSVHVLAAVCVALFAFGDAYRGLHLLTERHVVCAEHGELIHGGQHGIGGAERSEPGEGSYEAPRSGPAVEHHEHCSSAATPSRQFASGEARSLFVVAVPPPAAILAFAEQARGHARPALAYAPKQGPPA